MPDTSSPPRSQPVVHPPGMIAPGVNKFNTLKIREPAWIEIVLLDEEDNPVPYARYQVTLADGAMREGDLGATGRVRLEGITAGTCQVVFPELDTEAWEKI